MGLSNVVRFCVVSACREWLRSGDTAESGPDYQIAAAQQTRAAYQLDPVNLSRNRKKDATPTNRGISKARLEERAIPRTAMER